MDRRVVVVNLDGNAGAIAAALTSQGVPATACEPGPELAAELDQPAALVLAGSELYAPATLSMLQQLSALPEGDVLPVALVGENSRDAPLVRQLRSGVVELLMGPFNPRLHVQRVKQLLEEIPRRLGMMRGRGAGKELTVVLEHLVRTLRSGELTVGEGDDAARAWFIKGRLKTANQAGSRPEDVIARLRTLQQPLPFLFTEGRSEADAIVDLDATPEDFIERGGAQPQPQVPRNKPAALPPVPEGRFTLTPPPAAPPLPLPDVNAFEALLAPVPGAPLPPMPGEAPAPAPVRAPSPAPAAARAPPPSAPPLEKAPHAAETPVLLVDDDHALTEMFATYFGKKGYPVSVAHDGAEAMQRIASVRFEVVIADLNMPRLDGWGLLQAIRDDYRTRETLVALFSCHDDYRESLRALHAGAHAYYPKSLKLSSLEMQVRELTEPRRRFTRLHNERLCVTQPLSALGGQWVLRTLAGSKVDARIDAADGFSRWQIFLREGRIWSALAWAGSQELAPDVALKTFIASRGAEGSVAYLKPEVPDVFSAASTEQTLSKMVAMLNEELRRWREQNLKEAKQLDVNPELFMLYEKVAPQPFLPIAQALCRDRLLPRDVMQRTGATGPEIQQVVMDLLRRGVVAPG